MGSGELSRRPAVFLDRDGVINRNVLDPRTGHYGAPLIAEDFELAAGAIGALLSLRAAGFLLFLISNQPNFAKGKTSLEELQAVHGRLEAELQAAGIEFSAFYYCYHHPDGVADGYAGACDCRKPSPYFLFRARDEFGLSLADSWMVGDRATDVKCGRSAGVRTIRVREDHPAQRRAGEPVADYEAEDLVEAATIIRVSLTKGTLSAPDAGCDRATSPSDESSS